MPKGPDAFRTISEAAAEVGVAPHVLRFWETRFPFVKPMKRAGGRRFYRPQDVAVLNSLRVLLHERRMSIRSVQELHRAGGARGLVVASHGAPARRADAVSLSNPVRDRLRAILTELEAVRARVDQALTSSG